MSRLGMREPFPGQPPPLTNRPEGLLSLLGIQNAGRYPQHLQTEWLQPGIDLMRWYIEAEQDYPGTTQNLNAAGFTSFFQVPNDEQWIFLNMACETPGNLANAVNQLTLCKANSLGTGVIPLSPPLTIAAGAYRVLHSTDDRGFMMLMRPTTQLGLWQGTVTAANSFMVQARVVRMQVA